ncbi:MAG: 16S rRNA (adenine(1518)-N(6)/adenine(1519)-N(6))-dimethyltransferase RsmA [Clostridia bacterium]|nr:16S rRNA (adenine(1518)-N(6)/adenine(1519)-N(6))-dimethyltransferase RsmA [Clostridia bacterium]
MNLYEETRMLLNQYGLRANKRLGQNFLISDEIVEQIIEKSEITENDTIIEIGPGLGTLTKALLEKSKKVIAIELDPNMVDILKNRFITDKLEIIYGDVLKVDLNEIIANEGSVKVVANLPYYITTPILMKLLEERYALKSITVMVQKEVGERICSEPGIKEYGAITVTTNYYSAPKIIIDVPRENFLPSPEVDSCVMKLDVLEKPSVMVANEKVFFELIRNGFNHRRKTISNSLASGNVPKEKIMQVLGELGIDEKLRAEDLSIEDYANIANRLVGAA